MKNIKIDYSVIILITISAFCGMLDAFLIIYLIIFLHEVGHLFFIKLNNGNVYQIKLTMVGGILKAKIPNVSLFNKTLINLGRNC